MKKKTFFGMLFGILFVSVISFLFASKIVGDAKTASLFEMNGTTLVRYTGDSEVVTVPSNVKVIGKGNKERVIYLNSHARDALSEYLKELRNQPPSGFCIYVKSGGAFFRKEKIYEQIAKLRVYD